MIHHHARALIVPSSDLAPAHRLPSWADEATGMGRRVYDSWAASLPCLVEDPDRSDQDAGAPAGNAPSPAAPRSTAPRADGGAASAG